MSAAAATATARTIATMMMAMVTVGMMTTMMGNDNDNDGGGGRRAIAAADGMVWGRHQAARGGRNQNKAEMGAMWVLMTNGKFNLSKLLRGFIFNRTLKRSPFTSIFLSFSCPVVIIPSGLWQASYRTYGRRSYVVSVLTEILRLGGISYGIAMVDIYSGCDFFGSKKK
jgi:hypothetical protein